MLERGEVRLRAVEAADVPALTAWLADPTLWQLTRETPVRPVSATQAEQAWAARADESSVSFAVEVAGRLVGACGLSRIDLHNRSGDVGLWLGDPATRGRGYGSDVLALLVDYGFRLRGLHHLELETLASNTAMRRLAERSGFALAGVFREAAWVDGAFVDLVRYDLLATDPGARDPASE